MTSRRAYTVSEGSEDGGRIRRGGWHYPYCWRGWVHVGMPLEGECECESTAASDKDGAMIHEGPIRVRLCDDAGMVSHQRSRNA